MPQWNSETSGRVTPPPGGVSTKGRGFAPAGRGRGIAKWSSQDSSVPVYGNGPGDVGRKGGGGGRYDDGEVRGRYDGEVRGRYDGEARGRYDEGGVRGSGKYSDGSRSFNSRNKGKDLVECYRCEGFGHLSFECPTKQGDRRSHGDRRSFRNGESPCFEDAESELATSHRSSDSDRSSKQGHRSSKHSDRSAKPTIDRNKGECYTCGELGHISKHCPDRGGGGSRPGVKQCYSCGAPGHEARDCHVKHQQQHQHQQHHNQASRKSNSANGNSGLETEEDDLFDNLVSAGINFSKYEDINVKVTGDCAVKKVESFEEAGLDPGILKNLKKCGYSCPTPVQKHAIPNITSRRDLMACAQTGSGKTAAFLLPVIHLLLEGGVKSAHQSRGKSDCQTPEVVVVAPTRELAVQIKEEARKYSAGTGLKCVVAYGGTSHTEQISKIQEGCNILIATPGRLLDFVDRHVISLSKVKFLILDEADRMLDLGFKESILKLVRNPDMPGKRNRQTLMFSATFPDNIQRLASEFLYNYIFISVGIVGGACSDVAQTLLQVSQYEKREKLLELLVNLYESEKRSKTLVFVQMKKTADFLASYLCQSELPTTSIHGDRLQEEREEALRDFKQGSKPILVATAVAARGLDIKNVELVVNYDLPKGVEEYVHRIGRTGRLGNIGRAISFYDNLADGGIAEDLVKVLVDALQTVPEWLVSEARRNPAGMNGNAERPSSDRDIRLREHRSRGEQWS